MRALTSSIPLCTKQADNIDPVDEIIAELGPGSGPEGDKAPPHVFISHAGEQKWTEVDVLRDRFLKQHPELDVFVDEWSLKGGDRPMVCMGAACWGTTVGALPGTWHTGLALSRGVVVCGVH
jgi:hypothetical protein